MSDVRTADARSLVQAPNASFTCPHCGAYSQHIRLAGQLSFVLEQVSLPAGGTGQFMAHHVVTKCVACQKDTYFLVRSDPRDPRGLTFEILHQHPLPTMAANPLLPKEIAPAVLEAEKCLAVGAPNACGVMCRRAMHVLCQDKGATGKDLYEQLQDLKDRNVITPDLWEWAEELRVVGKHGAHPEWEDVTVKDADYAVRFLWEILRYVYVNPAERAARKMKENSVKK